MGGQEAIGLERRHAAHAGRGHGLAEHLVLDVAGGEHAGNRWSPCCRARSRCSLPCRSRAGRGTAPSPDRGRWRRTGRARAARVSLPVLAFLMRTPVTPGGSPPPMTSVTALSQTTSIFGLREQAVLHDLLGAQAVAPVDQRHLGGEVGEKDRLLDRGVAAADDAHFLAAEEEAVAGGAGRDAEAAQPLLARQPQPARLGAGADDQRLADSRCRRCRRRT